jgi:hypothetical protein
MSARTPESILKKLRHAELGVGEYAPEPEPYVDKPLTSREQSEALDAVYHFEPARLETRRRAFGNKEVDWNDPANGHSQSYLEKQINRGRNDRPLVPDLIKYITIENLHSWGLLTLSLGYTHTLAEGICVATNFSGTRPIFEIRNNNGVFSFGLRSWQVRNRLDWCFESLETGERFKTLYLFDGSIGSRRDFGATYHTQYQSKIYRKLMRIDRIVLQTEGDQVQHIGPARGKSKFRKLAELRRLLEDVEFSDIEREEVLGQYPQFQRTIKVAKAFLERELPKLPRGWAQMKGVRKKSRAA